MALPCPALPRAPLLPPALLCLLRLSWTPSALTAHLPPACCPPQAELEAARSDKFRAESAYKELAESRSKLEAVVKVPGGEGGPAALALGWWRGIVLQTCGHTLIVVWGATAVLTCRSMSGYLVLGGSGNGPAILGGRLACGVNQLLRYSLAAGLPPAPHRF